MRRRLSAFCLLPFAFCLFLSCAASQPPTAAPPPLPEWPNVPATIVESICRHLRQDALGEAAALVMVKTTQPIATTQSLTALAAASQRRTRGERRAAVLMQQRSIPIELAGGGCAWQPIEVLDPLRHGDMMVVELSSPLRNPFEMRNVGLFARVSLGGSNASWYWVSVAPYGNGWVVARITPLVM